MKTITVSRKVFVKLLALETEQETWKFLFDNQKDIIPSDFDLRLRGGLDHIEQSKKSIKFIDIGVSNGSNISDWSFQVLPRDKESKKNINSYVKMLLKGNESDFEHHKKLYDLPKIVLFAYENYIDGGYETIQDWTDFIFENFDDLEKEWKKQEDSFRLVQGDC